MKKGLLQKNIKFSSELLKLGISILIFSLYSQSLKAQDASFSWTSTATWNAPITFNSGKGNEVVFSGTNYTTTSQGSGCGLTAGNKPSVYASNGNYLQIKATGTNNLGSVDITLASNNSSSGNYDYAYYDASDAVLGSGTLSMPGNTSCGTFNVVPPTNSKYVRIIRNGATIRIFKAEVYTIAMVQAKEIVFSNLTSSSMTITCTKGDGANRAVFIKEDIGAISNPVDGTAYTASADWSSKGTQLGTSGYYCVYNGTGTSVDLTNLDLSKSYTVQIFEYNGTGVNTKYLTTTATDNPKTQASTLPISLTSFKTSAQAGGINLNWATSSENNADKFVIERRLATSAFVGINEVKAKGKASNYAFADKNVANGETYYYRLKMVDNDGTFKYSSLSSVNFTLNNVQTFAVYPNPATNSITVSYPQTGNAVYGLTITDTKGAILLTSSVPANSTQKTIDISTLKQGIYIININTKEGRKTLKLVKN